MIGSRRSRPVGYSLLEILVAASMLAVAVTALSQLASLGRKHLASATEQAIATRLATNQMARLAAGIDPPTPREAEPLAEDPDWECQIEVMAAALPDAVALPNVAEVRVHVRPAFEAGEALAVPEKRWYTLARWITLSGDSTVFGGRPTAASAARSVGTASNDTTSAATTAGAQEGRLPRRFGLQSASGGTPGETVSRPALP